MRKAKAVWHRDDDAVSPVIGTILMVAITVVLAAVLWLMVSGMISTSDEDKITVNLASPSVQKYDRGVTVVNYVWDATLNINKMTPKDEKVLWSEVKIIIKSAAGSILNQAASPGDDATATYDTDDVPANIAVEFWYVETTSGDTRMSAGDAIKVTGMTAAYEGASLELTKAGERIGSATMPTNFP
jgi:flagellin-like protein